MPQDGDETVNEGRRPPIMPTLAQWGHRGLGAPPTALANGVQEPQASVARLSQ